MALLKRVDEVCAGWGQRTLEADRHTNLAFWYSEGGVHGAGAVNQEEMRELRKDGENKGG